MFVPERRGHNWCWLDCLRAVVFPLSEAARFAAIPAGSARRSGLGATMAKTNPVEFLQQVRAETKKVTWPTRKETLVTTAMVFVMVFVASVFFFVVDQLIQLGVGALLGLG